MGNIIHCNVFLSLNKVENISEDSTCCLKLFFIIMSLKIYPKRERSKHIHSAYITIITL